MLMLTKRIVTDWQTIYSTYNDHTPPHIGKRWNDGEGNVTETRRSRRSIDRQNYVHRAEGAQQHDVNIFMGPSAVTRRQLNVVHIEDNPDAKTKNLCCIEPDSIEFGKST